MSFWFMLGAFFVSTAIGYFLRPGIPKPRKPSFEDLKAPTVDAASVIPEIFGQKWVKSNNIVWYGDLKMDAVKTKGGKK